MKGLVTVANVRARVHLYRQAGWWFWKLQDYEQPLVPQAMGKARQWCRQHNLNANTMASII